MIIVETDRLIIRGWRDTDRAPFSDMNQDPAVMRYLGPPLSRAKSDSAITAQMELITAGHPAFWAVERKSDAQFLGFIGVKRIGFEIDSLSSPAPNYEIGWRLAHACWGQGYATEGAKAALSAGFTTWNMSEIYSFTVPANIASQAVMQKIGMTRIVEGNFNHPNLSEDDPLLQHVLYCVLKLD